MADLVVFRPRREVSAQTNLQAFVTMCRDVLTVFGKELDFGADTWDLSAVISRKARRSALRVGFSSWTTANSRVWEPMPRPFIEFAKSYFRYQHSMRPTKAASGRIAALRAVCAALEERGTADPVTIDAGVLNRAAQLLGGHFSPAAAYRNGLQLQLLAQFMDENGLCVVPLHWKCPLPRPQETGGRVGEAFDQLRDEKLPSAMALDALARAFVAAVETVDVVVTSIAAIMCSCPDRVNEVVGLRADCEILQKRQGQAAAYGLRYWPSKGAEPMVKWVVPAMAGVVAEALRRLRQHTDEARRIAAWYEGNPGLLYLPPELEHLRGKSSLSLGEVADILFVDSPTMQTAWCKAHDVPVSGRGKGTSVAFVDLERAVLQMLPKGFPVMERETGLRYSQALCLVRRNELHAQRGTYRCLIEPLDQAVVSAGLGNRSRHGVPSVFDRMGFFDEDSAPIAIRTHQFRHYLNTLAQSGGMSELDIAKWSGRADVRHNSAYNHVSDRDLQARIKELRGGEPASFNQLVAQTRVSLMPRQKFAEMKIQAAHTTDLGFCIHDFAMSPCQLHLDCVNCNEQVCVKGDEFGEANARTKLIETQTLLAEAEAADAEGAYGAARWVVHQRLTSDRLAQLVSILDDPRIQRGAIIRLIHLKPASRLQQAAEARAALPHAKAEPAQLAWQVEEGKFTS